MGAEKFRRGYIEMQERSAASERRAAAPSIDERIEKWMEIFMTAYERIMWPLVTAFFFWLIFQMIGLGWI